MADWDCIVVGGGAAGLSAGLVLGRARRRTLLVDAGSPSNLPAHAVGGLLGHDQRSPAELYEKGRTELAAYGAVERLEGEVTAGRALDSGFELDLPDGTTASARTVLLAPGMDYVYPDLPGAAERWGNTVFHCPFCHGWEVRDRRIGILDPNPTGVHRSLLLTAWSDHITLYTDGAEPPAGEEASRLEAAGVAVETRPVTRLLGDAPDLSELELEGGETVPCGALLIAVTLRQRSGLAAGLGASMEDPTPVVADGVAVDGMFRTDIGGLWVAGDASVKMPSIQSAIFSGSAAAAGIVGMLTGAA